MRPVDVSIIVPTYNEQKNLPRLLKSINLQQGASFEVIVVDQESTDSTTQIAQESGARVITRERPPFYSPPSQSRNVGAAEASGDLLLHLDADMELPDDRFLQRFVALFDDDHAAAVIHEHDVANGWWNRVKAIERACYLNSELEYARGVTPSSFQQVGGYAADISSGEDAYIHRRYAELTSIARSDDVWLRHHTGHISLSRLLRKKFSYGRTASTYLSQVRETTGNDAESELIKHALQAYIRNAPKMLTSHPLVFVCVFPLRLAEWAAVRLGMRKAKARTDAVSAQ